MISPWLGMIRRKPGMDDHFLSCAASSAGLLTSFDLIGRGIAGRRAPKPNRRDNSQVPGPCGLATWAMMLLTTRLVPPGPRADTAGCQVAGPGACADAA